MPYLGSTKQDTTKAHIEVLSDLSELKKSSIKTIKHKMEAQSMKSSAEEMSTLLSAGESVEGIKITSRPPTPPMRPDSPNKAACPTRLQSRIPPPNFGAVADHQIFRSAFPQPRNIDYLMELDIKTMLCLVKTEPTAEYTAYVHDNDITRVRVNISPNKEGVVKTSIDSMCEALLTVLDASNYPLYIHCNQGRHRTGCVVACMRKVQGWPIEAILAEYNTYASPKMRPGDVEFITNIFPPDALLKYATVHGNFEHRPSLMTLLRNNVLDLDKFVRFLSSKDGVASSTTSLRSVESKADSGVDLMGAMIEPPMLLVKPQIAMPQRDADVSVTECDPVSLPAMMADSQLFFGSLR